jgi:uncharacterized membrane protein YhaH (DUF805 family)
MDLITKLENKVLGWARSLPHLPASNKKWLGKNIWWLALIVAIFSGLGLLTSLYGFFVGAAVNGNSDIAYLTGGYNSLIMMSAVISIVFITANLLLLALAIKPLKAMEKKGWVLVFMALLVQALAVVVDAILSFNVLTFILSLIYGAMVTAISLYFLFEIHGEFAHKPKVKIKKI